jgi:sodium transport system ATP-binding protein
MYFAELNDVEAKLARERIDELGKVFNFTEFLDKPVGKLSKGTRQKVALARAIVHRPPLMMLDEPMVGLDVTARRDVEEFILFLREQGQTIMVSDHALSVVERLCGRVAILAKGRLIELGTIPELCEKHNTKSLEETFFKLAGEEDKQ